MGNIGYYYLHANGSLISKRFMPESSAFVKHVWPVEDTDRADAWTILIEGLALGAKIEQVWELSKKWNCDLRDLPNYMYRVENPTRLQQNGLKMYLVDVCRVDYDLWMDWLMVQKSSSEINWDTMPGPGD